MNIAINSIVRSITAIIMSAFLGISFFYCPHHFFSMILTAIIGVILLKEWKNILKASYPLLWVITPLYPITPFILLIQLNESLEHRILIYYLFMIVFTFDTASYIFGTLFGKHKIIPSISPGKTWQGAIGGYIITTLLIKTIANQFIPLYTILLLSLTICTLAFIGDIFESYLKRSANMKDSGNLLPGHGGFLDRFDAIMAVSFFFFYYKNDLITIFAS